MSEDISHGPGASAPGVSSAGHDCRGALKALEGAYATTTISGNTSDFSLFADWCAEKGACPLPSTPVTLARYLDEMIGTLKSAPLIRRLAAVVRVHRALELDNPGTSERARLARRRIQRHRPNRPRQAHGIDRDLRA
ncbi:MAG: hypothetical protein Devi2KO_17340 [Devosia indica]